MLVERSVWLKCVGSRKRNNISQTVRFTDRHSLTSSTNGTMAVGWMDSGGRRGLKNSDRFDPDGDHRERASSPRTFWRAKERLAAEKLINVQGNLERPRSGQVYVTSNGSNSPDFFRDLKSRQTSAFNELLNLKEPNEWKQMRRTKKNRKESVLFENGILKGPLLIVHQTWSMFYMKNNEL